MICSGRCNGHSRHALTALKLNCFTDMLLSLHAFSAAWPAHEQAIFVSASPHFWSQ